MDPARRGVGVDHGRLDVDVAEDVLDGANIYAALQQVGRVGVTQTVGSGDTMTACCLGVSRSQRIRVIESFMIYELGFQNHLFGKMA